MKRAAAAYAKHEPALLRATIRVLTERVQQLTKERPHRTREEHLDQAVRAARHFLYGDPPHTPTKQEIADFIAEEEGNDLPLATLSSRWDRDCRRRGEEPITKPEVLRIAKKYASPGVDFHPPGTGRTVAVEGSQSC
jgi:hypothetical protein